MDDPQPRPLHWVGGSKRDLLELPDAVMDTFGSALHLAQIGKKHDQAKALQGFGSAGVLEVARGLARRYLRGCLHGTL